MLLLLIWAACSTEGGGFQEDAQQQTPGPRLLPASAHTPACSYHESKVVSSFHLPMIVPPNGKIIPSGTVGAQDKDGTY